VQNLFRQKIVGVFDLSGDSLGGRCKKKVFLQKNIVWRIQLSLHNAGVKPTITSYNARVVHKKL
jgi:hypothetical protein